MTTIRWLTAVTVLGSALTGCSDIGIPARPIPYESRLFIPFDDNGQPAIDTLRFRWPSAGMPVKYWVQDSLSALVHMRAAITTWKEAFLYGEFDATIVADSNVADVIVRVMQVPPKPGAQPLRFRTARPECEGATDIDTVSSRRELSIPVRVYLNPRLINDNNLGLCLEITATHEMGHSIGLFQHTTDPLDIMHSDPVATGLSDRDIVTIEALYHRRSDMLPIRP